MEFVSITLGIILFIAQMILSKRQNKYDFIPLFLNIFLLIEISVFKISTYNEYSTSAPLYAHLLASTGVNFVITTIASITCLFMKK